MTDRDRDRDLFGARSMSMSAATAPLSPVPLSSSVPLSTSALLSSSPPAGQPAAARRTKKLSLLAFSAPRLQRDGSDGTPSLDEEMDKVFGAMSTATDDKFSLSRLSSAAATPTPTPAPTPTPTTDAPAAAAAAGETRRYDEADYIFHRQHVLSPVRSMRRRRTSPRVSESDPVPVPVPASAAAAAAAADNGEAGISRRPSEQTDGRPCEGSPSPSVGVGVGVGAASNGLASNGVASNGAAAEALVSERAAESPLYGSPDALKRVQFHIGGIAETAEEGPQTEVQAVPAEKAKETANDKKKRKQSRHHHQYHHHHHHRFRKLSLQEDSEWRRRHGAELADSAERRRASIHPEEASHLHEFDLDQLTSHRFDDAKGPRRFRLPSRSGTSSMAMAGGGGGAGGRGLAPGLRPGATTALPFPLNSFKKTFDHSPHEVFVQLDELCGEGEDREWKETARWIKYEEHVEEGADRWGRPHVASLSFHSLLNLRRCLETGVVLLDLEERDLPGVAYRVVEQMVIDELILAEDKATVMRALLLRHRHVNEHERFRFGMKKSSVSYTSLQNLHDEKKPKIVPSQASIDLGLGNQNNHFDLRPDSYTVDMKEEQTFSSSSTEDLKKATNDSILKRIPVGAEATTVLVGAVDFLDQPTIAFIRLAEGILMPSITEVSIPVRFLFILLGPHTTDLDYHEIGRSISTLMANSQFHEIAYKADERKELLSAINDFLDCSIVLPPGDWENQALLPFDELKAKNEAIKRRKNNKILLNDDAHKALLATKKDSRRDPLRRTKRPWGGLINDIRWRFPHYLSDLKDGCNLQCLAASIFMYFAALSAAITFGGLMADKTSNLIGISETLIATSASGVIFALLAGQPLVIVGTTGPLLLFDESLYNMCVAYDVEYLAMRVYIGIWLVVIALVVSFFEGSVFVKVFTRFTEELFAALICIIYIVESVVKLFKIYEIHPIMPLDDYCRGSPHFFEIVNDNDTRHEYGFSSSQNETEDMLTSEALTSELRATTSPPPRLKEPNTALFCTILALGTFFIAYYLRRFRNSKFLGRSARRALGDFGVPIAIVMMVTLAYLVPAHTDKLKVPDGLSPSNPDVRGWVISPVGTQRPLEPWVAFVCAVPALLIYILLFMETHISELIIDKEERKLKKGSGFHLDIVLVCLLNMGSGFMGAPWVCAATVRSVAHVSAVTVMSTTHAPGEKPHIIEVKEQRLSSLVVAVLVGLSVLMAPLLRLVPMAVLFGVFLYMGISSIGGIQFFERLKLFFIPVKHHSNTSYIRRVATMKIHMFTSIQLFCLVILWVVKSTSLSLAFPFFLLLMLPLRAQLTRIFTPVELRALDSSKPDDEEEPDFYTEAPLPG